MNEDIMGFIIWSICALMMLVFGVICIISKNQKQFGFWANTAKFEVTDVRLYNRALGKLFIAFAIVLELLGLPLLSGQNSASVLFTIIGTMYLSITMMIIYVVVIEPKYRKK